MKTISNLSIVCFGLMSFCFAANALNARTDILSAENNISNVLSLTVTCPPNITLSCSVPVPPALPFPGSVSSPGCGTITVIVTADVTITGICPQEAIITRSYYIEDGCFNSTTCTQTITIEDNTPPVIVCLPDATFYCPSVPIFGQPVATDACDVNVTVTFIDATTQGICPGTYSTTRTWTATDDCANVSTCSRTIVIQDITPPVITCPPGLTLSCSASTTPANTGAATAIDNCDPNVTITFSDAIIPGICVNGNIINRTFTATDDCGNTSTCIQIISVIDNAGPVITCPPNLTLSCSASTTPANTGMASGIDNCDPVVTITFSDAIIPGICVNGNIINRTFTATDDCGNTSTCIQIISVIDNTAPVITCPPGITLSCSSSTAPANTGVATAIDNCDPIVAITYTDATIPGFCVNQYVINRTFIATDDCGNSSTCIQSISVEDIAGPSITCPPGMVISCPAVPVFAPATATDFCDVNITITFIDAVMQGSCAGTYSMTREWTATDGCGNSSTCSSTIVVQDYTSPQIFCPPDLTVTCSNQVPPPNPASVGTVDNCKGAVIVTHDNDVITSQICADQYTLSRTYRAVDACGNSSTCIQTITVYDNIAPILTCPSDITTQCSTPTFAASATDNCGGTVIFSYTPTSGSVFPQGVTPVTITATDACGNSASCSFTVTNYLGNLANYHMMFSNGSQGANWQGPTKGYIGDVAVDGLQAAENTGGTVHYAGTIYTNAATLSNWQNIVNANAGQANSALNEVARLSTLESQLENAFTLINALPVTSGYDGVSSTSLNNLNTQNATAEKIVINVTTGFTVSTKINITGDASDVFILRWDNDKVFSNGYDGIVKFQNGGAIVPLGGLKASNFIHVAGDIKGGGAGSNPTLPYPQGPRTNDGTGTLINGGSDFSGGGFFTGYWLTTGAPTTSGNGQPYGKTSNLTSAIFVGGWYSKTTKFSMGSGTSGVYVSACSNQSIPLLSPPSFEIATEESSSIALSLNVWPNPGDNEFTLSIGDEGDRGSIIMVYDIHGTKVLQIENPADQFVRFGENLRDGIYVVHVLQGQKQGTVKIFKQGSR